METCKVIPILEYQDRCVVDAHCRDCLWSGDIVIPVTMAAEQIRCPAPECGKRGFIVPGFANK